MPREGQFVESHLESYPTLPLLVSVVGVSDRVQRSELGLHCREQRRGQVR